MRCQGYFLKLLWGRVWQSLILIKEKKELGRPYVNMLQYDLFSVAISRNS